MTEFYYNVQETYESNFRKWWLAKKCQEVNHIHTTRTQNKSYITEGENKARELFNTYYKHRKIKVTRIKKY